MNMPIAHPTGLYAKRTRHLAYNGNSVNGRIAP